MSDKETKSLCPSCAHSIWCPTWAEVKCKANVRRIYNHTEMTVCDSYKKRDRQFKDSPCQCEDCLRRGLLDREEEE